MMLEENAVESNMYWWPRGVRLPEINGDPKVVTINTTVSVTVGDVSVAVRWFGVPCEPLPQIPPEV